MIRMQNEYRGLMLRAKMTRDKFKVPTEAECVCYQDASMLCSEMRRISKDEEKLHWEQELVNLNEKIAEIRKALDPDDGSSNNASGNSDSSDTTASKVPESEVKGWYKKRPKHGFNDVSGMENVIERMKECKADANCNELREYLKMETLHSFIFVGPPGCGKTYIIEAFAHELMGEDEGKYSFISLEGADILRAYVGEAETIVKRLFEEIMSQDNCIVFIDEIESLCRNRATEGLPIWASDITTAFLTGYNKLVSCDKNIFFIGATNFPNDVDDAMFDRVEAIMIGLPDTVARAKAFERAFEYTVKTGENAGEKKKLISLEPGFDYEDMAEATENYNYRDIDRLLDTVKKKVVKACNAEYPDQKEAVAALKNGFFCLTKKMFEECRTATRPSQKDNIMKALADWEKRLESREAD